jgi:histidine ammonia-lyase
MAPLAARRVAEMAALGGTITAIELAVAAQAVQLRGLRQGRGTARALAAVRRAVPYLETGDHVADVAPLADAVRSGELGREVLSTNSAAAAAAVDSGGTAGGNRA